MVRFQFAYLSKFHLQFRFFPSPIPSPTPWPQTALGTGLSSCCTTEPLTLSKQGSRASSCFLFFSLNGANWFWLNIKWFMFKKKKLKDKNEIIVGFWASFLCGERTKYWNPLMSHLFKWRGVRLGFENCSNKRKAKRENQFAYSCGNHRKMQLRIRSTLDRAEILTAGLQGVVLRFIRSDRWFEVWSSQKIIAQQLYFWIFFIFLFLICKCAWLFRPVVHTVYAVVWDSFILFWS